MLLLELLSALGIFTLLVLCTLIPYCYLLRRNSKESKGSSTLSICNCVACGIFLSTCFLGLVPHVRHQEMLMRNSFDGNSTDSSTINPAMLPNTEAVVLLGFLLILIIEQALMSCSPATSNHHCSPKRAPTLRTLLEQEDEDGQPLVDTTLDDEDGMQDIIFRSSSPVTEHDDSMGHSHLIRIEDGLSARTLFLLLGLSIHSVFEGVALGVQNERADFFNVLVAIMFHEVLCCFAYGVSMAQQRTPIRSAFLTSIILSATIPVGMLIALMVDHAENTNSVIIRFILEGLAAGTFIYVACVEMLSMELHNHSHSSHRSEIESGHSHSNHGRRCASLGKATAVCFGVVIFWVLQVFVGRHHE
ncbi:unnamed protein product [Auanema sp. JU1783]|nr:unnamed protein product [Auanema sp. JU1783]